MTKYTTTIRFSPEEKSYIQDYADFSGTTFSDVVRSSVLEFIDDFIDIREYDKFKASDDGVRYSLAEVREKLFE